MKDLGQEAMNEMNRLLLNQKQLKMKLEKMGNYGESATIKNQLADASKTIERLQEQLNEANEVIKDMRPFIQGSMKRETFTRILRYEDKWGVK